MFSETRLALSAIVRTLGKATSMAAGLCVAMPVAHAASGSVDEQGGAYLALSAGASHPLGQTDLKGVLTAGATAIPFTGAAQLTTGWSGRVAVGYEEHAESAQAGAENSPHAPRYRVEGEVLLAQMKRRTYAAGLLQVEPRDRLNVTAFFANAYARLMGKGTARLWAGAGVGYARLTLPDARPIVACACLGPAKGQGIAYQGKLAAELRIAPGVQLVAEAALVRLPGLSTAERPLPVAAYSKSLMATANAGARMSF